MADHAATVATMYEAFGRGDVDSILEHLSDDVEWEGGVRDTGLDYLRERHGKQEGGLAGRSLRVLDDTIRVVGGGEQVEIFELSGPRESGPPPHSHPWDEAYIGIDGDVEITVADATRTLRAGDVAFAPGGTLHCYRILTDTASFRVITSGHRASAFFADMDANAPAGSPTPDTLPTIVDVARRNGLSSPLFA